MPDDNNLPIQPTDPSAIPGMFQPSAPSDDGRKINPITGNETLGPPEISNAPPPILPGADGQNSPASKHFLSATPVPTASPTSAPAAPTTSGTGSTDELLAIKQSALQTLRPLVDSLDETPEERFKSVMALIQASDDPTMVKEAHELANQIQDPKARAQALLNVVNEVNYFTKQGQPPPDGGIDPTSN